MAPLSKHSPALSWLFLVAAILSALLVTRYPHLGLTVKLEYLKRRQPNFSTADVIIVGGGHAGLSAALTLYRHQHTVIVFDNSRPRNAWDTPTHAMPGWENTKASEYRAQSRAELLRTGFVRFVDEEIESIERKNESWHEARSSAGRKWEGKKVLLAMGTNFRFPSIPGYTDFFPDRIFHCLFTFGFEHRGSEHAGILAVGHAGSPFHAAMLVQDAEKFARRVTVYTNGNPALAAAIRTQLEATPASNATRVDDRKLVRFTEDDSPQVILQFEDGTGDAVDFIVHQPGTMVNEKIVAQLDLELTDRGDIATKEPFYQTNVPGVFAAGDCASRFKIIANALLMGSNAAAGVARELPRQLTGNAPQRVI